MIKAMCVSWWVAVVVSSLMVVLHLGPVWLVGVPVGAGMFYALDNLSKAFKKKKRKVIGFIITN